VRRRVDWPENPWGENKRSVSNWADHDFEELLGELEGRSLTLCQTFNTKAVY